MSNELTILGQKKKSYLTNHILVPRLKYATAKSNVHIYYESLGMLRKKIRKENFHDLPTLSAVVK